MEDMIEKLQTDYKLDIVSPFSIDINGQTHSFDCLIKGYGATNGMVIDQDFSKISPVQNDLVILGYGFSCFDINQASTQTFQEMLNDWGKNV